jgi:hypothetical protein
VLATDAAVVDTVTAVLQAQHALLAGGTPEARLLEEVLLLLLLVVSAWK